MRAIFRTVGHAVCVSHAMSLEIEGALVPGCLPYSCQVVDALLAGYTRRYRSEQQHVDRYIPRVRGAERFATALESLYTDISYHGIPVVSTWPLGQPSISATGTMRLGVPPPVNGFYFDFQAHYNACIDAPLPPSYDAIPGWCEPQCLGSLATIEGTGQWETCHSMRLVRATVSNDASQLHSATLVHFRTAKDVRGIGECVTPLRSTVGYFCPRSSVSGENAGIQMCIASGVVVSGSLPGARSALIAVADAPNEEQDVPPSVDAVRFRRYWRHVSE